MRSQLWVRMAGYRNYVTYAGRKLNNKLRMAGYRKYISYRYEFISSFVSLTKYAGRKLKTGFRFYPTSETEHYQFMRLHEFIVK